MTDELCVARAALHMWEEPCISGEEGSGAVFFSGCTLRCVFCQNRNIAAAQTGKIVNVKKGQFVSGAAMKFAVEKIRKEGNDKVILTERGNSFGYQDLVVDYRNIPWMKAHGVPVVMDCTHSLQQPNQSSGVTGGNPELIGTVAKAAIATGADGLFIETHPNPAVAKSDGANMLRLDLLEGLLIELVRLKKAVSQ